MSEYKRIGDIIETQHKVEVREAYIRGAKDAIHELMRRVKVMPPKYYGVTGVQLRDLQVEIDCGEWPPHG